MVVPREKSRKCERQPQETKRRPQAIQTLVGLYVGELKRRIVLARNQYFSLFQRGLVAGRTIQFG